MRSLGIVGFGSFGRFMTEHLRAHFDIVVHDRRDVAARAAELGVRSGSLVETAACEVVVLAVPVQDMEGVLTELGGLARLPGLVLDVGSVKTRPLELMPRLLPDSVEIVGTHPMFGPQSGRDGIGGLKIVVCPLRTTRLGSIRDFLADELGLEVIEMSPSDHDREMAYIQGLTHWIAKALREIKLPDLGLATPAYRHLLKIEEILREASSALFRTIHNENPFSEAARAELLLRLREIEAEVLETAAPTLEAGE
ncbi:MAG: prephenate dehydrogenase [Acidobacteriota bacterium]|nr:prephenate dehydrogenase [Acidobacteriota bacterium]